EQRRLTRALREAGSDPLFREALTWQNRHALQTGVDALLRQPETASNSKARQHERLIANYLQRYCVKNDWIGFFGPTGWATVGPSVRVQPGPALLATRT